MLNKDPGTDSSRAAYLPFLALALLALVWGYNWVVMKVAVGYTDPFTFTALRNILGAVCMFLIVGVMRRPLRPQAAWWTAVIGVLQTGGFAGLAAWAVYSGGAGKASVLAYTMPFWLLLLAWPVFGERVRGIQWASVLLALAGLVLVLGPWNLTGLQGSMLAVGAGFIWAVTSVLTKMMNARHKVDLLNFVAWQSLFGSIPLIVVALVLGPDGPHWTGSFIAALVYNVLPASALAWVLWFFILNSLPAGTAGVSSLAIPVVGVVSAWIQLAEQPGAFEGVGMVLILTSLAILTVRQIRLNRAARVVPEPVGTGAALALETAAIVEDDSG